MKVISMCLGPLQTNCYILYGKDKKAVVIDPAFYANRVYDEDEVLAWDIIDPGVTKAFLLREKKKAYNEVPTPSCHEQCSGCGANTLGGERSCCPMATC